jgi:hypothetical protein
MYCILAGCGQGYQRWAETTRYRFGTMILSMLCPPDWPYERGRDCHPRQRSPSTTIIHHTTTWLVRQPAALRAYSAAGPVVVGGRVRLAEQQRSRPPSARKGIQQPSPVVHYRPATHRTPTPTLSPNPPAPTNHPTRKLNSQDGLCFVRFQNGPPLLETSLAWLPEATPLPRSVGWHGVRSSSSCVIDC